RLRRGPVPVVQVNTRTPVSDDAIVVELMAQLPDDAPTVLPRIAYPVADASAMPLANGSQAAVVAIFFSDIVPLQVLLQEITRVLQPGGRLICFGPLVYTFSNPVGHLTPGEAKYALSAYGFRVEEDLATDLEFQAFPDSGLRREYRIWSYVATRS
ncbi:MAG: methyltransferase domain-containing protein, partial [Cyanobacteria bacterium REEB65]|nr:methyltransferase domain-containing protein [Cyanobacteria bacterium REEB65]